MAGSHTSTSARDTSVDASPADAAVKHRARTTGAAGRRVDGHLAAFAEHMREALLAASTAVGMEVLAELMDAEVTELVGQRPP